MKHLKYISAIGMMVLAGMAAPAEIKVPVGHNESDDAAPGFKFRNVPSHSANDAGSPAKFVIIDGERDPAGGGIEKLHDGELPEDADQPAENFFFNAGTPGGRLLIDLGGLINVKQVNTYSWHPGPRAPHVYKLYSAGETNPEINAAKAPELNDWAQSKLAPVLAEWYPKIAAMLPSEGFTAPAYCMVTLKPVSGVAYTTGAGIVANSKWLQTELNGDAIGSLVHEMVHVVQHYHGDNPGWLVEGMADYIRWFKYEPGGHGAALLWMRKAPKPFSSR